MTTTTINNHNWSEITPSEAGTLAAELLDVADTAETPNVEDTTNDNHTFPDYFDPISDAVNHAHLIA